MACVPCAIEMEPKTLNPGELNHVREQAEAIQKMEPENAADIFVQGLEPITKDEQARNIGVGDGVIDPCIKDDLNNNKVEKTAQCLCTSILMEPLEEVSHGEPLTAPF